ncbi:MAG: DUF3795 domain-containing protein [Anaerolineae bacterium]|nr:DUF3795 domain-containing protein [Anaerolineae bacterium]
MVPILTRCGYRCDLCLAYQPNVRAASSKWQIPSDGWYQYFGFRLPPAEICCDGRLTENPKLIDQDCPFRPCVIEKGIENCSQCQKYDCAKLAERLVMCEELKQRVNREISSEDYLRIIRPYENKKRLDDLRSGRSECPKTTGIQQDAQVIKKGGKHGDRKERKNMDARRPGDPSGRGGMV